MDLIEIKEILDEKKAERDRLSGQQDSYMEQLKELGFSTIKSAETALKKMQQTIDTMQEEYEIELEEFESKYKELIYAD